MVDNQRMVFPGDDPNLKPADLLDCVPPVGVRNFGQQVCIRSLNFQRGPKPTAILFG
jgi:hypothetical protein